MNDPLLIKLSQNKDLMYNKEFCNYLASALHTFYIKGDNYEAKIMKIIGKSKLDNNIVLMPKQIEMLHNIDKFSHCVLSAPTSFGKSFLILEYLKRLKKPLKFIIYIVHTKALADEIYNKITKFFSNEYNIIDDYELYDETKNNIAILISDGKNMIYFDYDVDLLIVDEAYNLDKKHCGSSRFLTIYNCYRILLLKSKKVILLGPFIKDLSGPESKKYILFRTNYSPVTSVLKEYGNKNNPSDKFIECIKNGENTIGFINSKTQIYLEMDSILKSNSFVDAYTDNFIEWMEDYFPNYWMLPKLMKKGIAIYHSAFPKYINLYNMRKFNDGTFKGLLTTSAILEGVNTSAKNIVVFGTEYNGEKLSAFQFFNLCGRAGRLNKEIVGNVYNYGESYEKYYDDRCLTLYIGDSPITPEDKFDEGIFDESTKSIENKVKLELDSIGIAYDNWYEEFKYYFSKCFVLLNLITLYKKFRESLKRDMKNELLVKSKESLDKNKILEYVYNNYIYSTPFKYTPHSQFLVQIVLKELLKSNNKGIDFNLKTISNSDIIAKNINKLNDDAKKNQYIVEIMRTGYEYIPYKFYYISILLNEFISHDSYFEEKEKKMFLQCYFDRIKRYLKLNDDNLLSKLLSNRGLIPPLIAKILSYISSNNIDVKNKKRSELLAIVENAIKNINLTNYEKINLEHINFK